MGGLISEIHAIVGRISREDAKILVPLRGEEGTGGEMLVHLLRDEGVYRSNEYIMVNETGVLGRNAPFA